MPRLRPSARVKAQAKFEGLISTGLVLRGMKKGDLAPRMGISEMTMLKLRKNPWDISTEWITRIGSILGISKWFFIFALWGKPSKEILSEWDEFNAA